jgi:hypothetical protein
MRFGAYVKVAVWRPKAQDAANVQARYRANRVAGCFIRVNTISVLEWRRHRRRGNGSRRRNHSRCTGAILRWREDNHRSEGEVCIAVCVARNCECSGRSGGATQNRKGHNARWTGRECPAPGLFLGNFLVDTGQPAAANLAGVHPAPTHAQGQGSKVRIQTQPQPQTKSPNSWFAEVPTSCKRQLRSQLY